MFHVTHMSSARDRTFDLCVFLPDKMAFLLEILLLVEYMCNNIFFASGSLLVVFLVELFFCKKCNLYFLWINIQQKIILHIKLIYCIFFKRVFRQIIRKLLLILQFVDAEFNAEHFCLIFYFYLLIVYHLKLKYLFINTDLYINIY